jgi:hypothetical protein
MISCFRCSTKFDDPYIFEKHMNTINLCQIVKKKSQELESEDESSDKENYNEEDYNAEVSNKYNKCIFCLLCYKRIHYNNHQKVCKLKYDPIRLLEIKLGIKIDTAINTRYDLYSNKDCSYCNTKCINLGKYLNHREICDKRDTYYQELLKKEKQIESGIIIEEIEDKVIETDENLNYIYLIKLREFIKTKENIYKIGKTKQENLSRVNSYPKGSILIIQIECDDCDKTEKELIKLFKEKYIHRKDIGNEYFEGLRKDMKKDISNYI